MLKFVNTFTRLCNTACIGFVAYQVYDYKYNSPNPYMEELDKFNEFITNPEMLPKSLSVIDNTLKYYNNKPNLEMLKDYPNIIDYMSANTIHEETSFFSNTIDVYKYHITFKNKSVRINKVQYELDDNDELEVTQDNGDHLSIKIVHGTKYVKCEVPNEFARYKH